MSYLILWRAVDKPTLFESDKYESYPEADAALAGFHKAYPWNTYLLVEIKKAEAGNGERAPIHGEITVTSTGPLKITVGAGDSDGHQ